MSQRIQDFRKTKIYEGELSTAEILADIERISHLDDEAEADKKRWKMVAISGCVGTAICISLGELFAPEDAPILVVCIILAIGGILLRLTCGKYDTEDRR